MSWIKVIPPEQADGKLETIYRQVTGPGGQVDQVLQAHSLRPHTLEGHMALYKAVLHHSRNQMPEWFLEAIGVQVSRLNGCEYCDLHHSAGLQRLMKAESMPFRDYEAELGKENPGQPFNGVQQASLAYVTRLTRAPGSVGESDITGLRQAGLDDGEILEINQVAAYFCYANRTVSGLGVNTEGETLGLSPQAGEGREAWRHD
jgi:uncharacterized peroxidase-related enzyme